MGLFFMSVGMSANPRPAVESPTDGAGDRGRHDGDQVRRVVIGAAGTATPSARKLGWRWRRFAFVLFGTASSMRLFSEANADLLVVAVTVSMLLAPLLFHPRGAVFTPWLDRKADRAFDTIEPQRGHVVVAMRLRARRPDRLAGAGAQGRALRRTGEGRAASTTCAASAASSTSATPPALELLHAANAGDARLVVLAIDDPEDSVRVRATGHHFFPVPVIARPQTAATSPTLTADMGIAHFYRETGTPASRWRTRACCNWGFLARTPSDDHRAFPRPRH